MTATSTRDIVNAASKLESAIGEIDNDVYNAFRAIQNGELHNDTVLNMLSNALDNLQVIRGHKPRNLISEIPVSERTILAHLKSPVKAF